jgi:outer membrane protein TolC
MLELNRRRARLGSASAVDVLRMEAEVATTKAQILAADEAVLRAREALGLALGTPNAWGVSPNISLDTLARDAQNTCKPEESLEARYDIKAARANVDIARRNVDSVDHLFVPTVDAVSTVTYWDDEIRTANRESVTWTIGGVLTWNIYDGGLRYGLRQTNEALLRVTEDVVTDRQRAARVEVDRAVRNIEVAEAQLEVAGKTAEITRQSAKFAQITFLNGTGTSFDMVDTARNQRQAEIDVAIREFELLQAKITAFLAMASCDV